MSGISVTGGKLLQRGFRCVLNNPCIVSQLQHNGLCLPQISSTFAVRRLATQDDKPSNQLDIDKKVVENLQNIRDGKWGDVRDPEDLKHFRSKKQSEMVTREGDSNVPEDGSTDSPPMGYVVLPHPIWSDDEIYGVKITHKEPERFVDKLAYSTVKTLRSVFDVTSGFNTKERDDKMWINRICFLETVAGVPGMVAAMVRHLHSLRRMRRDHGWIHTLLEEAENERMHLMTALSLKQPTWKFRAAVLLTQGVFVTYWGLAYLVSARYCHRFVGYLEEEAVITYTKCLQDIDGEGPMKKWKTLAAPPVAIRYWQLPEDATMRDVILAIRADEAHHRVVNHTLASMKTDDYNPYKKLGSH